MYFADIPEESANIDQFMNDLAIPQWLEDSAVQCIERFYENYWLFIVELACNQLVKADDISIIGKVIN